MAITYRGADILDARLLFDWRNDELTRAMSRSTEPVTWDGHLAWLEKRLARSDHGLYIAEDHGTPIGTFRIDGDEISYTVAPEHRGKHYAVEMLKLAQRDFGAKQAKIFPGNIASIKAAMQAGHVIRLLD